MARTETTDQVLKVLAQLTAVISRLNPRTGEFNEEFRITFEVQEEPNFRKNGEEANGHVGWRSWLWFRR